MHQKQKLTLEYQEIEICRRSFLKISTYLDRMFLLFVKHLQKYELPVLLLVLTVTVC